MENPPHIHVKNQFTLQSAHYSNPEITAYASDNAPGKIFLIANRSKAIAVVSVDGELPDGEGSPDSIHVRSQFSLASEYSEPEITEFTLDGIPDKVFVLVNRSEGIAFTAVDTAPAKKLVL